MFRKTFVFLRVLTIFLVCVLHVFSKELPTELLGFQINTELKSVKKSVQLKKIKNSFEKVYKVLYIEQSIETYLYFFNKKIYKIIICFSEKVFDQEDWENIVSQAISLYDRPKKVFVTHKNGLSQEVYLWEDEKVKYMYKKFSKENKIQNFSIELVDKHTEQKITQLSFIKKLYLRLINLF